MASYTDSPQVFLPKSTPFADLGLYDADLQQKQNQYNLGVQRVQNSYDQVAGMDVVRGVDKQYLQDKLGDLTTQLNKIAGGDFSNQSLVSQAASLAPKIAKDPNVQAAIISTQNIRNLQSSAKTLRGKSPELYPTQAEDWDQSFVRDYLNSPELGKTYNGPSQATPYSNYSEPLMKMIKEKVPAANVTVQPGGKFSLRYDKTSKITQEDIDNIVNGFFQVNPQHQQSQKMDASYTFKNYDASAMFDKVSRFGMSQINGYAQKEKDLTDQLKTLKNNPYLAPQVEKELIANRAASNNMTKSLGEYYQMFKEGAPLSQIKERVHMDQIRGLYTDIYQQETHDVEYKENIEAIQSTANWFKQHQLENENADKVLKFYKAGINPLTGQAITPEDPEMYQRYVNANSESFKREDEGKQGQLMVLTPEDLAKNTSGQYSDQKIDDLTNNVGAQLSTIDSKYRKIYAQGHNLTADAPDTKNSFAQWCAQNEDLVQNPDKQYRTNPDGSKTIVNAIDKNYLQYRKEASQLRLEKDILQESKNKINQDAINVFPVSGGVSVDVPKYKRDGQEYNSLYVQFNHPIVEAIANIKSEVEKRITPMVGSTAYGSSVMSIKSSVGKQYLYEALDKYRNDPKMFAQLKALSQGSYKDWESRVDKIRQPISDIEQKRQEWKTNEYNTNYATRINYAGHSLGTDKEKKEYKGYLLNALSQNAVGHGGEVPSEDQVDPIAYYTGNDGKPYIRYVVKNGKTSGDTHDIAVPVLSNIIGKPDPFDKLKSIIHSSWNGETPSEGPKVMVSDNGRLKYSIGESAPGAGPYNFYLIDGVKKIPINRTRNGNVIPYMSPGEILQQVDEMSKMINPNTKQPFTFDEIISMYNNPVNTHE